MKLSIVIVNYNVRYFLEQCLLSVSRAVANFESEVFVVDNASGDGSVELIRQKFPFVKIISNESNIGFAKANNLAINLASGDYILLLNPDTVIAEDTLEKCISFMDARPEAGALGVRMIDGKGNFLPESKRGLPTPAVAFYKTFGLAALFPKSQTFGRYHLGFLSESEIHEVDVLSGAFMFLRKSAIDKTGFLDEAFFMYGEDVDLSYRILKAGYKNFYFPETTIVHYKGESTKKGSLNYVKVFYSAMIIFARKHFSGNQSAVFSMLINLAIVLRGFLTLLANIFSSSYLFLVDAGLSFAGIFFIKTYWEDMIKYHEHYYPNEFLFIVVPVYIVIWILAAFLSGSYDKPFRISNILRGILLGTIAIAVVYAFIPNEWRFSRAIILLGAAWTGFEMLLTRTIYHLIRYQSFRVEDEEEKRSLVIGKSETVRAENILRSLGNSREVISTGDLAAAPKTSAIHHINEIVFCSADFSFREIIASVNDWSKSPDYRILNAGSDALIGSNSKNSSGDLFVKERSYALFKPQNRRSKRVLDLAICMILIPLMPFNIFLIKNLGNFFSNWLSVARDKKSWVGLNSSVNLKKFPHARPGVLHPALRLKEFKLAEIDMLEVELDYAAQYSAVGDLILLLKNYGSLGR